jgi:hypothetical protein
MNIRSVGAELFRAERQTHRYDTKLTVAFRNFANVPEKETLIVTKCYQMHT